MLLLQKKEMLQIKSQLRIYQLISKTRSKEWLMHWALFKMYSFLRGQAGVFSFNPRNNNN